MFFNSQHIPKKPGVYRISNTITGESYIGGSTWSCRSRVISHMSKLRCGKHISQGFQHSFLMHGEAAFKAEMIERCHHREIEEREAYWIRTLRPAFNTQLTRSWIEEAATKEDAKEAVAAK